MLKEYLGCKLVKAEPMKAGEANQLGLIRDYVEEMNNDEGYRVVYEDGYESWSPKETFEKAYKVLTRDKKLKSFGFGRAIKFLKQGKRVARKGWNGKGMFLCYVTGIKKPVSETPYDFLQGEIQIDARIDMYTAGGTMQPGWLASQADMLAEDWVLVD